MRPNTKIIPQWPGIPTSVNEALQAPTFPAPDGLSKEDNLRRLIRDAADQLCQVVDGDLNLVVRVSEPDDDIDKLLLLVNFVLASARRSFKSLHEAHRRVEEDLAAARKLQEKLLPQALPQPQNLRVSANFVPARTVGGDFFDFFRYKHRGLEVGILADVSGKGPAAAIYAALVSGIVRSLVHEELKPDDMLERLNDNLFTRAPDGQFVAATYYTWDDERLVLETCNSGLPEPLLCRDGKMQSLQVHGLPLGLFHGAEYEAMRVQCKPGDTLFFYTDGIPEAVDPEGNEFGVGRLSEIILNNSDHDAADIVNSVLRVVSNYCRCEANFDDQTAIGMKVL